MSFRRPNQKTQTNEKFSDKKRAGKIPVEAAYPKHKAGQTQTKHEVQTKEIKYSIWFPYVILPEGSKKNHLWVRP